MLSSNHSTARELLQNEVVNIPVVVHVIYNNNIQNISDAQILSQINALNEDFRKLNADTANTPEPFKPLAADCKISFRLARTDMQGRPTNGIVRKYTNKPSFSTDDAVKFGSNGGDDAWDSKKYINIWVCNLQNNTIGFSSPPNSQPDRDGVVIQYDCFGTMGTTRFPFNKGRTATHEIGHWLGLKHIWGDSYCGNDGIDDTPTQYGSNYNCPVFPSVSACSSNPFGDMFMNFMDYTDDACMNLFTIGQQEVIRNQFATNGIRNSFLYSTGCDTSMLEAAGALPADTIVSLSANISMNVSIYPNPVKQYLNIQGESGYVLLGKQVSIYNTSGKLVFQQVMRSDYSKIELNDLSPGMYFLAISENGKNKVLKFIKL
jgi:hypothetical protein